MTAGEEPGNRHGTGSAIMPRAFVVDVRKFTDYVLVPGHKLGKDRIFLGRLGFRRRNLDDARFLVNHYVTHARHAVASKDYELGAVDGYGIRCTIIVPVRGVAIRSGWLLRPNGVFELVTPFSGFAHPAREESP